MNERDTIARELTNIEQGMKELEIRYEQYFSGAEKREPIKDREKLAQQLRRFVNRRVTQTDLRFKSQNLATRFHSYSGYWDRILRLMDEGRYVRQTARVQTPESIAPPESGPDDADVVFRELVAAREACKIEGTMPTRQQVAAFLEQQKGKIREKFGNREVEFLVVTEDGKPKIKARAKR
jgi:hypothetical protein